MASKHSNKFKVGDKVFFTRGEFKGETGNIELIKDHFKYGVTFSIRLDSKNWLISTLPVKVNHVTESWKLLYG